MYWVSSGYRPWEKYIKHTNCNRRRTQYTFSVIIKLIINNNIIIQILHKQTAKLSGNTICLTIACSTTEKRTVHPKRCMTTLQERPLHTNLQTAEWLLLHPLHWTTITLLTELMSQCLQVKDLSGHHATDKLKSSNRSLSVADWWIHLRHTCEL